MKLISRLSGLIPFLMTAACWPASCVGAEPPDRGFQSLFDGKSLTGWKAVPAQTASDWSVCDGAVCGRGSADRLSYLVWKDHGLTDFELRLQYRLLTRGNTGIEVRARPDQTGKRPFEGYHADLGHVGIGANVLGAWDFHFARRKEHPCPRGTRLVIQADESARVSRIDGAFSAQDIRQKDWNDVRIIAEGNHFQFLINGKRAADFTDNARQGRLKNGAIGLQLHDKGMVVEFRRIRLRDNSRK